MADYLVVVDNQAGVAEDESLKAAALLELSVQSGPLEQPFELQVEDNQVAHESEGYVVVEAAKAPPKATQPVDESCNADSEKSEEEAPDRRMTYIGEGLLDAGGMDAIDRLTNDTAVAELEGLAATSAAPEERATPHSAATSDSVAQEGDTNAPELSRVAPSPEPASNKLQAFLSISSAQKQAATPPKDSATPAPATAPRPFPPLAPPQAPAAAPPMKAPAPTAAQVPTVQIENRRSKLLDFLANDVGERYLDGVYQEETRDDPDAAADAADLSAINEAEQERDRQRRAQRADSRLIAFLAKERGERLHRVERDSDESKRGSLSSESSASSLVVGTETPPPPPQPQQQRAPTPSKLLQFVAKTIPEKPKMVIFNPSDAASGSDELEQFVAEEARKKKLRREERERARQKVMAFLAEENAAAAGKSGAAHGAAGSTVKSVDESTVQREKVVDRYGREGLLDFLDRTEPAQQRKIRWATSRGASSPANSASSSPTSAAIMSPQSIASPAGSLTGRGPELTATPSPSAAAAPSRPPNSGNRLALFLSKITSKSTPPPLSSGTRKVGDTQQKPLDAAPLAAAPIASVAVSTASTEATASADASSARAPTSKTLPVLAALEQLAQTCAAHELSDVCVTRVSTLLASISQIVKDDVQKKAAPVRRSSSAGQLAAGAAASPSWVKSGKEIEALDREHTVAAPVPVPDVPDARSAAPAMLERSSELKVAVAPTVLQAFNDFELAPNLLEVVSTFHTLAADCGLTDLKLEQPWAVYEHVKAAVAPKLGFRQKQLFKLLDAKLNGPTAAAKPAARKRVCIIGAGPVGLRAAVEMALLGAHVVVLEKRRHFSRENILHLWPWVVQDLTALGAKVLFPAFCHSTAYFHVGTRQLQCILLKVALLLGVAFFPGTAFEGIAHPDALDSGRRPFYTVVSNPQVPWLEFTAVLGAGGTQDRLSAQARIKRFVFSRKEAIGLVCYFPNRGSAEEKRVPEFSWTIQFKQQLFAQLRAVGVDLENLVYYRGEMHYLVMTPRRQNLLDQGVLKLDYPNVADLVADDNINQPVLHAYLQRVVQFVQVPQKAEFARVRLFDFSARTRADKAASILSARGKKLYVGLIGDALIEPFWPEGLGTCRGFLSALDGCWMVAQAGVRSDEQLLADRELAYRIVQHVTGFRREDLQKNVRKYDVDPKTRYTVKFPQLCA
ncbi:hypothetical protein PybrP1_007369 [[Pythium] brassicae (nom. inval.)]|nr:hypothetical protein PybrP1_007369 [[Pythium] brassicae (nom. inval.)]